MCFSAEADVVAGLVVGGIGIDALRHVHRPAENLLAALPVVLGAHQLIEAFVWWGAEDRVPHDVSRVAVWLYLSIAFGLLPVFVPLAVGALEPAANVRRIRVFAVAGVAVAVVLMYAVVRGPVDASIEGRHIDYRVELSSGGAIVALYVAATCGSMLVSKHRHVRWFGAANLCAVGALAWLNQSALISLWCVWAAATSVAIAVHIRYAEQEPKDGALPAR